MMPPTKKEKFTIRLLITIGVLCTANFLFWFFRPEYKGYPFLYYPLVVTISYSVLRKLYIWYHYLDISKPQTPKSTKEFSVDILTTYFPGEPYDMIIETLEAIQKITYPHTTYLCDEANDPYLIEVCKKLGVKHVTRTNRINAKAGNINNALKQATGEICVILDPDHVPLPNFLDPIIPHFENEKIGFVQIVQSYYNIRETLVAKGAAEQTFQFYGPMMMSMNSYGTTNAIGANCTFRRAALDSIGGHAPGLSEDMHTSMLLHAKGWESVYVPLVLAKGLAPSSLTSFFKQQLKWARGTFDLLFYVYPKLFKNFTLRQKFHYGLLPLHYLVGLTTLINFLIPILSLLLSKTPWSGNILFFIYIILPMSASTLLIRAYIQKWVIEKEERGFHLMGGLLQIATWWVYLLGFIYTIIKKKIPYLPTPKDGENSTNLKIAIPNLVIGILSIFSVIYGLSVDLTPFSLMMSGFAVINTAFMFFSLYLATSKTNDNRFIRNRLKTSAISFFVRIKSKKREVSYKIFSLIRPLALPLLMLFIVISFFSLIKLENNKWDTIESTSKYITANNYLGIFQPTSHGGLSNIEAIEKLENKNNMSFDIISVYLAWGDEQKNPYPKNLIEKIYKNNSIPLITWEPWASDFTFNNGLGPEEKERKIFKRIKEGIYDAYILKIAKQLKSYKRPVFLRFAHEFDNPFYPWSPSGDNTSSEFIKAWKHIHSLFGSIKGNNVVWVWNPWKPNAVENYFPGSDYVDWIGVTALNYGTYNSDGKWYEFEDLYKPFHEKFKNLPKKPVMLTEFGSLKLGGDQASWSKKAIRTIKKDFPEIKSIILFNSNVDDNIPKTVYHQNGSLDWTFEKLSVIDTALNHSLPKYILQPQNYTWPISKSSKKYSPIHFNFTMKGVRYKKGQNWKNNHFVLDKDQLEKDFELIQSVGFNTLRYEGLSVYDQNVLKYSEKNKLNIIYSFWIPSDLDFVSDSVKLESHKKKILKKVTKLKSQSNIIAWNIGNDLWDKFNDNLNPPIQDLQKIAYIDWIKKLAVDLKEIDADRVLSLDVKTSKHTKKIVGIVRDNDIPIDMFSLIVSNTNNLNYVAKNHKNILSQFYIGDILGSDYLETKTLSNKFIIRNWQDQWESHKLSFDGLLDKEGRKKYTYDLVRAKLQNQELSSVTPKIRILPPSTLLNVETLYVYHALLLKDDRWIRFPNTTPDSKMEWSLIKTDSYGNPLASKKMGYGPQIQIKIPDNYHNYKLMLTYKSNGVLTSAKTILNTPLLKP
ncbi:glycosyltransferase family 2 protein [Costertonia aggregata]|uniref:Glycosyltransferase n=1 Tax=Costertonia aggregata TaxID=343403 RepID=A0A7H9ATA9_9FLAO|nr:glycosyltransferase family 2 protein [Costertonia aggregata]QLG46708.1 glycosyltransferase [Costertonia aggregata]